MLQTSTARPASPLVLEPHSVAPSCQPLQWLEHEARLLLGTLRHGTIPPTAYDTAWLAQVPDATNPTRAHFPSAITWLLANQHADGSWGASTAYVPDQVLSTLAALCALARYGQRLVDAQAMERGVGALWRLLSRLQLERAELAGFELLLPALVNQCHTLGVPLPESAFDYVAVGQAKLARIPVALRYSPEVSLSMSVEFMGPTADIGALRRAQSKNGSLGNSPAATAFFLTLTHDEAALAYLEAVQRETGDGVPFAHPIELYEPLWVLDHLRRGGLPIYQIVPRTFWSWLAAQLGPSGISFSESFAAPDLDDTAIAIILLAQAGYPVDARALATFQQDGRYMNYAFERNPSTSANIHALEALLALQAPLPQLRPVIEFVSATRTEGMFWHDKWHLSPFYTTCHAIFALCALPNEMNAQQVALISPAIRWLTYTQRPSGAWGWLHSSVEETAYVLLALTEARRWGWNVTDEVITRGTNYLEQYASVRDYYPLWIGKCLFAPTHIIHAAVLGARYAIATNSDPQQSRVVGR